MTEDSMKSSNKSKNPMDLFRSFRSSLLGMSTRSARADTLQQQEEADAPSFFTTSDQPKKSELRTSDLFTQLRKSDLSAADILSMSEANNPTYRPSSLRNTSNLSISSTFPFLPSSFEEAVYGDFDTLLEFARSQHQEESLAFWLAVEDFRQFEKRYEHNKAFDEMRREFALDSSLPAPPPLKIAEEEEETKQQQDDNNKTTSMLGRISGRMNALGLMKNADSPPTFLEPHSPRSPPRRDTSTTSTTREEYVKQRKRKMSLRKRRTNIKYNHDEAMLGLKSAMLEYAQDIFCEFLDENSDHWICLHERISADLHDKMERADIDSASFDEAQRAVFVEMKTNLYPGYLKLLRTRHANLQQQSKKSSTVATTEYTTGRQLQDDDDVNSDD